MSSPLLTRHPTQPDDSPASGRKFPPGLSRLVSSQRGVATVVIVTLLAVGCAFSPPRDRPHRGIEALWRDFVALPRERALALAGDPDGLWVAGAAGGEPSKAAAEESALKVCADKRAARRMQAPCRLYATGEKIVWGAW